MQGHSDWVRSVSFNHDDSILASGSDDYTIKLWSMPGGQFIQTLTVSDGGYQGGVCVRVCVRARCVFR